MRDIETRLSQIKGAEVLILDVLSPGKRWSMNELIVILTTMLLHDDPEVTEDYVAEHVHASNMAAVTMAIGQALNPVLPEPAEAAANGSAPDPRKVCHHATEKRKCSRIGLPSTISSGL